MLSSDWSSVVFSSDLRLDHVAVAAGEVVETVCVDVEQVAGAVPAVGRERLVALAPVVAPHQSRTAQPELAHLTSGEVGAGVGVDDPRIGSEEHVVGKDGVRTCSTWWCRRT